MGRGWHFHIIVKSVTIVYGGAQWGSGQLHAHALPSGWSDSEEEAHKGKGQAIFDREGVITNHRQFLLIWRRTQKSHTSTSEYVRICAT